MAFDNLAEIGLNGRSVFMGRIGHGGSPIARSIRLSADELQKHT